MGKLVINEWKGISLSLKGKSHEISGLPCQDSSNFDSSNNVVYGVLSDGAGSAKNSNIGSALVVKLLSEYVSSFFEQIYNEHSVDKIRYEISNLLKTELKRVADSENNLVEEYASTAMFVAIKDGRFIMMHLGDGLISYSKNGEIKIASSPNNGEFINSTVFVTSKNIETQMNLIKGEIGEIDGFILMSDGTAESFYHRESKSVAPVLSTLLHRSLLSSKQQYLKILEQSFEKTVLQNTNDDCSIVLICKETSYFPSLENINIHKKYKIFRINSSFNSRKKRLNRLMSIWNFLSEDRSIDEVSKNLRLPPKYTKKHLNHLLKLGMISHINNEKYSRK
ncbi:PP2C family serine/threonine-protein phosphatase [Exiguobacterium artemiae]